MGCGIVLPHFSATFDIAIATTGLPNSLTTQARSAILALFKRIFGAGCKSRPAVMLWRLETGDWRLVAGFEPSY